MDRTSVFSKAGKGLLEIKSKSNRLSKDEFRVLNLVDGKATLAELVEKSRITEIELRKILRLLSDDGFIKELGNTSTVGNVTGPAYSSAQAGTAEVDDLDFTQVLGPSKSTKPGVSQSAAVAQRERGEAERKAAEAAAAKGREEAARRAKEEAEQRARVESEKRAKEEADKRAKDEADKRAKDEAERRAREEEAKRRARAEAEREQRRRGAAPEAGRGGARSSEAPCKRRGAGSCSREARSRSARKGRDGAQGPRRSRTPGEDPG